MIGDPLRMKQARISSFKPVYTPDAKVLILGSIPGIASLKLGEYYAHPRNHFWAFMQDVVGVDCKLSYKERINELKKCKVALWDVLQSCVRKGSLDTAIQRDCPNDLRQLVSKMPRLQKILLNGRAAEKSFTKYFSATILTPAYYLPSTSPANAGYAYHEKRLKWQNEFNELILND